MPKYAIGFTTEMGALVRVEADNEDEAIDKAYEELPAGLCIHCCGMGFGSKYSADIGEWQLDEKDIRVVDDA